MYIQDLCLFSAYIILYFHKILNKNSSLICFYKTINYNEDFRFCSPLYSSILRISFLIIKVGIKSYKPTRCEFLKKVHSDVFLMLSLNIYLLKMIYFCKYLLGQRLVPISRLETECAHHVLVVEDIMVYLLISLFIHQIFIEPLF